MCKVRCTYEDCCDDGDYDHNVFPYTRTMFGDCRAEIREYDEICRIIERMSPIPNSEDLDDEQ